MLWPGKRAGTAGAPNTPPPAYPGKRTLTQHFAPRANRTAPDDSANAVAMRGLAGTGARLPHAEAIQASFGHHDVSGIEAHVGGDAAAASEQLGAHAFATGNAVGFAASPDLHTAAHEAAHVIQQARGVARKALDGGASDPHEQHADAVADAVVAGKSAEALLDQGVGDTPAVQRRSKEEILAPTAGDNFAPGLPLGTAREWMAMFAPTLVFDLDQWLQASQFAMPTPYAGWKSGSSRGFAEALWTPIKLLSGVGSHYLEINKMLMPDRMSRLIDAGRDAPDDLGMGEPRGALIWSSAVTLEVGKLLAKRIIESLQRVLPQWLAARNRLALAAAGPAKATDRDPQVGEVIASHPMDRYVVMGLANHVTMDLKAYQLKNPNPAGDSKLGELRAVEYAWQFRDGAWNWLQAVKPANATPEEVAKTLYGDETFAHTLTDARPYFGFVDTEKFLPAVQTSYANAARGSKTPATKGDWHGFDAPERQLQTGSALTDAVVLAQAANVKPSDMQPDEGGRQVILDRMTGGFEKFLDIYKASAPIGNGSLLEAPMKRLESRIARVADKTTPMTMIIQWDGQTQAQNELLESALNGVKTSSKYLEEFKSWPDSASITRLLGFEYINVAALSEQATAARAQLANADQQSRLFPVTLMESLLASLRKALHGQKGDKTGVVGDKYHDATTNHDLHVKQEAKLRLALARIRDKLLQNPDGAAADLKKIVQELLDLQNEVSMVADMDLMDVAWKELYKDISAVGVISGSNTDDGAKMDELNTLNTEWRTIYALYQGGAKEEALKLLEKKRPAFKTMLKSVETLIKDNQTKNKWVTFALMVGIALITAGIGTYVQGLAGAAWGATSWATFAVTTGAEAIAFTSMSYALVEQDPTISGFFLELGKNMLLFGALKGLGNRYTKLLGGAAETAVGKGSMLVVQFVALNVIALAEADIKKYLQTGQHLSTDEILEISKQNALFLVATALGARLVKPGLESLHVQGHTDANMIRLRGIRGELKVLNEQIIAEKGVDFAKGKDFLLKQRELLRVEEAALQRLEQIAADPKLAAKARMRPKDVERLLEMRKDHDLAASANKLANTMSNIEGSGSVRWVEHGAKWQEAVDGFRSQEGTTVTELKTHPKNGARGVEVTTETASFKLIERMSEHEGVVAKSPELGARGPTAAEVDANRARAAKAIEAFEKQTRELRAMIDGVDAPKFDRIQIGGDIAGVINQATMPEFAGGKAKAGSVEWPRMLTVSDKAEVWRDRGPVNQTPGELEAPGVQPSQMTTNQHAYMDAAALADAIALGRYESGMSRYEGWAHGTVQRKATHTVDPADPWTHPEKATRIRIKSAARGDRWFYADHIDITVGPGPSAPIDAKLVPGGTESTDPTTAYNVMLDDGRLIYGDQAPARVTDGVEVLVWGGSGNGAAMAEHYAKAGRNVRWVARVSQKDPPPQIKPRLKAIEDALNQGDLTAADTKALIDERKELLAFGRAMLPRNVEEAFDSPLAKEKIHRSIDDIHKMEPIMVDADNKPVADAGRKRVKVTLGSGVVYVDQVVVSLGQAPLSEGAAGGLTKGMELVMVLDGEGKLVGLQSTDGAVTLKGAAFADPKLANHVVAGQREAFLTKVAEEAAELPPNSRGVAPSIANASRTITAANDVLAAKHAESYKLPGDSRTVDLKAGEESLWPAKLAVFFGGELGIDPARITIEPVQEGKSGTPIFRVRIGAEELGFFKVFSSPSAAANEVAMIRRLTAKKLTKMQPVGERGTVEVTGGDDPLANLFPSNRGGMMMETAEGSSVDAMIKNLPTEAGERASMLARLKAAVLSVAHGLGEMHREFASGEAQQTAQKAKDAEYIIQKLDAIKSKIGPARYDKLKVALAAQAAAYEKANVPATAAHGDANVGNFVIGADGKLRVIDFDSMKWSFDMTANEPTDKVHGTGAADVARFLESLESKRPGALTPDEIATLTKAFKQTYFEELAGGKGKKPAVTEADLEAATTLYRAELEMSIIRDSKPSSPDVADTTFEAALARLERLLGIEIAAGPAVTPKPLPRDDDKKRKTP